MNSHPRIWWDGNDFIYLMPGPLLGMPGYDKETRPTLYRARELADVAEGSIELQTTPDSGETGRDIERQALRNALTMIIELEEKVRRLEEPGG